jgi:hypothetical protein
VVEQLVGHPFVPEVDDGDEHGRLVLGVREVHVDAAGQVVQHEVLVAGARGTEHVLPVAGSHAAEVIRETPRDWGGLRGRDGAE